jgi:hypothetical protein
MKTFSLIAATVALAGSMAGAHGATLAAAPIYTNANGNSELCLVTNYSASAVKLTSVAITNDPGSTSLPLVQDTCKKAIASGGSCRFAANIPQPPGEAYTCIATAKADAKTVANMRMTNEQLDVNANGLYNEPGY